MESGAAEAVPSETRCPSPRPRLRRALLLAGGLLAALLLAAWLDTYALRFHERVKVAVASHGWLRDVINPLRELGGFLLTAALLIGLALIDRDRRRRALVAAIAVILSFLLAQGLKFASGRARPEVAGGATVFTGPGGGFKDDDYGSFPSGHTTTAFTVAAALALACPSGRPAFYTLAAGCGAARVAEGRHFPSDVLSGALIGIFTARLLLGIEERRRHRALETAPCAPPRTGS